MDNDKIKALSLEELDLVAGGATDEQWEEWANAWKTWWIQHYGDVRCHHCGRRLGDMIPGYDVNMAYDTFMNNAFLCKCGQVIRATESWT